MARAQTEPPLRPLEEMLAEANEQAKQAKPVDQDNCLHCGHKKPTQEEIASLATMPHAALLSLAQQVCKARWGDIAKMNKDERMEAARLKLWQEGLTASEMVKYLPALREAMDREIGKAAQSIALTVKEEPVSKLTDNQLAAILAQLPNPLIIPPPPKVDE